MKRFYPYIGGVLSVALMIWLASNCSSGGQTGDCDRPGAGSLAANRLDEAGDAAAFPILYPCDLPAAEELTDATVTGTPGKQIVELRFDGPFDVSVRQAQFAPIQQADPTGASRISIDLFPNVRATLIERNDGTNKALYHFIWERNGIFYEVQASGPPLQRDAVRRIATSLQ
ncbi:MAG TPA: hypothetical protein VI759_00470 [Dehalococcoidia bacterium]|nr:hypothetical protein [Dehalococcoidia bacterium]